MLLLVSHTPTTSIDEERIAQQYITVAIVLGTRSRRNQLNSKDADLFIGSDCLTSIHLESYNSVFSNIDGQPVNQPIFKDLFIQNGHPSPLHSFNETIQFLVWGL